MNLVIAYFMATPRVRCQLQIRLLWQVLRIATLLIILKYSLVHIVQAIHDC